MKHKFLFLIIFFTVLSSMSAQKKWNVYVFLAEECPVCNYMGKPLSSIAKKYADDVSFYAVFPTKISNYKSSQIFKEQYDLLSFETILDKDLKTTKLLGASVTPEVIITDESGEVLYRGRINSAYYAPGKMKHSSIKDDLDEALATIIKGEKVAQPWPSPVGCYITMNVTR